MELLGKPQFLTDMSPPTLLLLLPLASVSFESEPYAPSTKLGTQAPNSGPSCGFGLAGGGEAEAARYQSADDGRTTCYMP